MKVLVVGATSFHGAPLIDALAELKVDLHLFSRDPRLLPKTWRDNHQCFYGDCLHSHVLHEALEGCNRVVACLFHGVHSRQADAREVLPLRALLQAAAKHRPIHLFKLSSSEPLLRANWWAMQSRRRADQLVDACDVPSTIVEMGWIAESLAPLLYGNRLWLPNTSKPIRGPWQSRKEATRSLAELVLSLNPPRRVRMEGRDFRPLTDWSADLCAKLPELERVFLPAAVFPAFRRILPAFAYMGERLYHSRDLRERPSEFIPSNSDAFEEWPISKLSPSKPEQK